MVVMVMEVVVMVMEGVVVMVVVEVVGSRDCVWRAV